MEMEIAVTQKMFSLDELYAALKDPLVLKILLYLKEKNPLVPAEDLAEIAGITREHALTILSKLVTQGFVKIENPEKYTLDLRARNAINAILV